MFETGAESFAKAVPWLAAGLSAASAGVAYFGFRRLRDTTLAAPAVWGVIAAAGVGGVELLVALGLAGDGTLALSLWRYAAAVGTCMPIAAVLGAKRPQDRGWQWVVVALWMVLLVPAAQAALAPAGHRLELFAAWKLLLAALMAMGLLNYLPTRHWLAALLATAGQACLVWEYLFDAADVRQAVRVALGQALLLLALAVAAAGSRRRRTPRSSPQPLAGAMEPLNYRWLNFRDDWGAFWALRVMQRINQSAELGDWPVRLDWSGFQPLDKGEIAAASPPILDQQRLAKIEQTLDAVLRRFERG